MARHDAYKLAQIDITVVRRNGSLGLYVNPLFVDGTPDYDNELCKFNKDMAMNAEPTQYHKVYPVTPAPRGVPADMWQEAIEDGFAALNKLVGLK